MRWPEGPPHLALNPPYLFLCVLFFGFFVFFGGFKGQVRWPEGPPHLALNPPYCFFVCLFFGGLVFSFLSLLLSEEKSFPPKVRHFLFIFECLPLFLLSLFGLPLVQISLSLSLSCSFLSFFLLVFCFCFLLVPSFSLFLSFSVFFAFVS